MCLSEFEIYLDCLVSIQSNICFMLNVLFVNFCVNIKIPMKRDIFLRYNYEIVVYIHMLIKYLLFYCYFIIYG